MKIDDKKQRRQNNQFKTSLIQWQQFAGMILFLVVDRVYRHNQEIMLLQVFYMISYVVFLGTTVKTLRDIQRLFPDKEDKMNEERVMFHENMVEEIRHDKDKNNEALKMFIEKGDPDGLPADLFMDWMKELYELRKTKKEDC